jgi:hypothetical protein
MPGVGLTQPYNGEVLQGIVRLRGTTLVSGFRRAVLEFGYPGHPTGTWFLIAEDLPAVVDQELAQWDTRAITDGDYDVRLVVSLADDTRQTVLIEGVRIRNDTPIETATPPPVTATVTPEASGTPAPPTATATATPTPRPLAPLPTNPARLPEAELLRMASRGALVVLALFALIGLVSLLRANRR